MEGTLGLAVAYALRGTMSSRNIVRRKTHSLVLVDSEADFGDDQLVIGVAVERRGSSCEGDL